MPRRKQFYRWTSVKEEARHLLYDEGWSPERVNTEAHIGKETIKSVQEMHKRGLIPGMEKPVIPNPPDIEPPLPPAGKDGAKKPTVGVTDDFAAANLLRVVPQSFTTTSQAIYIAMQIAREKWHWQFHTPGEFLDRFLVKAMFDYGFQIHGYVALPWASLPPEDSAQGDGNVEQPEEEIQKKVPTWTGE